MNPYAFCENSKRKPFCQKLRASRTVLFALLCGVALKNWEKLSQIIAKKWKPCMVTFLYVLCAAGQVKTGMMTVLARHSHGKGRYANASQNCCVRPLPFK